jgi:lipopolysaccharide transport system ATP-binding protein
MGIAIKVENLSKVYQLGEIGTGTLSNDLKRWAYKVRGKEDPFLKIGETNDRTTKSESNVVWSLKDLNFEIEQGDAVGIIGRNGAGKSTLLKILSRVTSPTTGSIKIKGRVASLLEVGTGFHPELTGRENIFLNGAILGMRKSEIKKHFDAIVDFAGIERYIDTPVKRYSSGMYVRLAFAVAAHLESEILVVDEVLAVGDAEFQKKCLGKMNDVSKGEGRTVLFVSHNMDSVSNLCSKGILLNFGQIISNGEMENTINDYLNFNTSNNKETIFKDQKNIERSGSKIFGEFFKLKAKNKHKIITKQFHMFESLLLEIELSIKTNCPNPEIGIAISNQKGQRFHHLVSTWENDWKNWGSGMNNIKVEIPHLELYPGLYNISIWFRPYTSSASDDFIENAMTIEIIQNESLKDHLFKDFSKSGGVYKKAIWHSENI